MRPFINLGNLGPKKRLALLSLWSCGTWFFLMICWAKNPIPYSEVHWSHWAWGSDGMSYLQHWALESSSWRPKKKMYRTRILQWSHGGIQFLGKFYVCWYQMGSVKGRLKKNLILLLWKIKKKKLSKTKYFFFL